MTFLAWTWFFLILRHPLSKSAPQNYYTTSCPDASGPVDGRRRQHLSNPYGIQPATAGSFPVRNSKILKRLITRSKRALETDGWYLVLSPHHFISAAGSTQGLNWNTRQNPTPHTPSSLLLILLSHLQFVFHLSWILEWIDSQAFDYVSSFVSFFLLFLFSLIWSWIGSFRMSIFEENLGFCYSKLWFVGGNRVCLAHGSILDRDYDLWWFCFFFFFLGVVGFWVLKAEEDELNDWGMRNGVKSRGHRKIVFPSEFFCVLEMSRQATHLVKSDGFNLFSIGFGFYGVNEILVFFLYVINWGGFGFPIFCWLGELTVWDASEWMLISGLVL